MKDGGSNLALILSYVTVAAGLGVIVVWILVVLYKYQGCYMPSSVQRLPEYVSQAVSPSVLKPGSHYSERFCLPFLFLGWLEVSRTHQAKFGKLPATLGASNPGLTSLQVCLL